MSGRLFLQIIGHSKARRRALAGLFLICACVLGRNVHAQVKPIRRVLIFYEIGLSSPSVSVLDQQIRTALENSTFQIELYREFLETTLFPDPKAQREIRDGYIHKYRDLKPDVVITLGLSPLRFLVDTHDTSFKDVPIVFGGLSGAQPEIQPGRQFTGVWDAADPIETLKAALRLRPGTRHVFVVGGQDSFDLELEAWFRQRLQSYESTLDVRYVNDLAMPRLLEKLSHLPPNSIILLTHIGLDAAGTRFVGASQADPMIAKAANAPIFGPSDVDMGHGEVGGYLDSFALQGKIMGEMAIRILNGERPQNIPIVNGANVYMFDWRALKRWKMKEANLPPGSIVLNRRPSFWELYKRYVLVGIFLLLVQSVAIVGLLWQRARRRKTEADLRKSEEKFARSFRDSPLAMSIVNAKDDCYVEVNETFEQLTGWKCGEVAGRSLSDINLWVDPDERRPFLEKLLSNGTVRNVEVQIRTKDGQIRTTLGSAEVIEVEGEPCVLSVFADITHRKQAEEALSTVSRRLIGAQEQERTRIARELHDDINQRIAMLSVEFDRLEQNEPSSAPEHRRRVKELQKRLLDLGIEIQAISHRLHSSKLEYLGLAVACRSFCTEIGQRNKVTVNFSATDIPRSLPQEISLCVFRVLQESLNNAIKYSGVERFDVQLRGELGEIELKVRDDGVGFDAESAMNGIGLGLISMRERASLVSGTMSITSKPNEGTEVTVRVPFASAENTSEMTSGVA